MQIHRFFVTKMKLFLNYFILKLKISCEITFPGLFTFCQLFVYFFQVPHHCCPQCPQQANVEPSKCLFLDREGLPLINYHHGQKWLSQCQECECMVSRLKSNLLLIEKVPLKEMAQLFTSLKADLHQEINGG